jgi:hypothetical protein
MSSLCDDNYPGAGGNSSSGLTQKRNDDAIRFGSQRNTNGFNVGSVCCGTVPQQPPGIVTVDSSVYTQKLQTQCPKYIGRTTATSEQHTNSVRLATLACNSNAFNAETRFASYNRFFPTPCPPIPAEQLNSTTPKPPIGVCQPSRFF